MNRNILSAIKSIDLLFLLTANLLGLAINHYLGNEFQWTGFWNGLLIFLLILIGCKLIGKYFQIKTQSFAMESKKKQETIFITLMSGVAFFAISIIPLVSLIINHLINPTNVLFLSMGIFIIGMVEIFPSQTTQWGLEEFLKAFLYANIIPAFAFSLQVNVYHRLVFLLTFPLFFLYIAFFIIDNISSVYDSINESSGSLLKKIGSFAVLRLHNLSLLMGYLILLAGTFFELPWKLIWPALMTIPIGLIQIWQVNQILSGRKPNIQALVFTAVCIALFTAYFSILYLWLN